MSWLVELTSLADADADSAYGWYELRQTDCGEDFLTDLDFALLRISESGDTYERVIANCHRIPLRKFPYNVYYELRSDGTALIRAILHTSRRPGLWKRRLRAP